MTKLNRHAIDKVHAKISFVCVLTGSVYCSRCVQIILLTEQCHHTVPDGNVLCRHSCQLPNSEPVSSKKGTERCIVSVKSSSPVGSITEKTGRCSKLVNAQYQTPKLRCKILRNSL